MKKLSKAHWMGKLVHPRFIEAMLNDYDPNMAVEDPLRVAARAWAEEYIRREVAHSDPEDRDDMAQLSVYLCPFMDGLEAGMRLARPKTPGAADGP